METPRYTLALVLVNLALNHFAHVYTIAKFHVVY